MKKAYDKFWRAGLMDRLRMPPLKLESSFKLLVTLEIGINNQEVTNFWRQRTSKISTSKSKIIPSGISDDESWAELCADMNFH
jgi:hypothetical protein